MSSDVLHFNAKHSDKELLDILRNYSINVKFPTVRDFKASKGLPCSRVYIDRFGSFQKAIIEAGIEIPKSRLRYFNREELPNEILLKLLKEETDKLIKKENRLLTAKEITKNKKLPSEAVYHRRFGGLENAYRLIGYEMNGFGKDLIKKEMTEAYVLLSEKLGRTPSSRDIDNYSKKGFCKAMKTYETYFGSLYNLQVYCDLVPTKVGRNKSKEELVADLKWLKRELGRVPNQLDLINFPTVASSSTYINKFGGFVNALEEAGMESNKHKIFYTKLGTPCYSRMEHLFAQMLEKYKISYEKDVRYSDWITNYDKRHTFDFVISFNNKKYFIEIFGIIGVEEYDKTKNDKILACKDNNLPLIQLTLNNFWSKKQKDMYQDLIKEINQLNY